MYNELSTTYIKVLDHLLRILQDFTVPIPTSFFGPLNPSKLLIGTIFKKEKYFNFIKSEATIHAFCKLHAIGMCMWDFKGAWDELRDQAAQVGSTPQCCWGGIISRRARIRRQRKCVCSSGKKKIVQCLLKGEHAGFIRWAALLRVRARVG